MILLTTLKMSVNKTISVAVINLPYHQKLLSEHLLNQCVGGGHKSGKATLNNKDKYP
jgi:hypothetical protein